jgi:hypothetical protein
MAVFAGRLVAKYHSKGGMGLANQICPESCLGRLATPELSVHFKSYLATSLSSSTWQTYSSGWNNFVKFEECMKTKFALPLNSETLRTYVTWCLSERKLKVSTVKLYLSSLNMAHTLRGLDSPGKDKLVELVLTGAENVEPAGPRKRRAMTMDLLLILGHKIASADWSKVSKQVVWTACTVSFYCSVRLGEILASQQGQFDRFSTLTWENVMFIDRNEALLYIPSTKSSGKGEFIDLFPVPGHTSCPVTALKKLKEIMMLESAVWNVKNPVFMYLSGKFLTVQSFNGLLKDLLDDVCGGMDSISAHSFRAAIPSAISAWPDRFQTSDLKDWSRWRGDSYVTYCRSYRDQRRKLFGKIVSILK